jgi:hypothetical protein
MQEKSAHECENKRFDIAFFQKDAHSFERVWMRLKIKGLFGHKKTNAEV